MIRCSAWPRVKIGGNTEVWDNVGYITGVEVVTTWFAGGGMIAGEARMGKDVNGESSFTIIFRWRSPYQ